MSTLAGVYKIRTPLPNSESKSLSVHKKNKAYRNGFHHFVSLIYTISSLITALNCIKVFLHIGKMAYARKTVLFRIIL